mmetsp:Transcript_36110/g.36340  ORF Transcript_36110/g.36340 Transcript_36110/m.36340 type:complete len:81 (+) Transcript_36110:465-707(+)
MKNISKALECAFNVKNACSPDGLLNNGGESCEVFCESHDCYLVDGCDRCCHNKTGNNIVLLFTICESFSRESSAQTSRMN